MKSLKQLREEYENQILSPADFLPEEVMLETAPKQSKKTSLMSSTPSFKQMPSMLLFRRITYRAYPGGQTVALYYSSLVDKYLSIPFGPQGNLNLSEAVIHEKDDPCWKGYEMVGMKKKGGRMVPNCVPVKEESDASDETGMAKTQLRAISSKAHNLDSKLKSAKNLPAWVQSKIAVAKDGISAVDDYMSHTGDKLDEEGFDLDAVTNAIRSKESRNDYGAKSKSSSASGAYQYINKTWRGSASKSGVDTKQFPTARSAPKEVQDKVFQNDLQSNAKKYGSLEKAVNVHYSGNPAGKVSAAGLKANRGQTAGGYMADIKKRVDDYNTERKSTMGAAQQMAANFSGGNKTLSTPDFTQYAKAPEAPKATQVASAPEAPKMQNPDQERTKIAAAPTPAKTQMSQLDTKSKQQVAESEAWTRKEGQNPEGGLNRKGIMSYRRKHPGSKLSLAVTTKPSKLKPGSKAANRRKSFCARMGGMKKRLTSAKTANDPNSRINKSLRKWNCEESFQSKISQMREERLNESPLSILKSIGGSVLKGVGSAALSALTGDGEEKARKAAANPHKTTISGEFTKTPSARGKKVELSPGADPVASKQAEILQRKYAEKSLKQMKENKMSDIRKMVRENVDYKDLYINGRPVTLNRNMAKRILEVYDSVNAQNKKIVEGMLNEDMESFKKLINFSIKA